MITAKETLKRCKALHNTLGQLPGISVSLPVPKTSTALLKAIVKDIDLYEVVSRLFYDGHHARAVEEAFKFLNNLVKDRADLGLAKDGVDLMRHAFSPRNPVLRLNSGAKESEQDEQLGYMEIMAGCMTGIRNPRAHEHDWEDSEDRALELLALANHLVQRVKLAAKV